jgi:hypothetical protein
MQIEQARFWRLHVCSLFEVIHEQQVIQNLKSRPTIFASGYPALDNVGEGAIHFLWKAAGIQRSRKVPPRASLLKWLLSRTALPGGDWDLTHDRGERAGTAPLCTQPSREPI